MRIHTAQQVSYLFARKVNNANERCQSRIVDIHKIKLHVYLCVLYKSLILSRAPCLYVVYYHFIQVYEMEKYISHVTCKIEC